MLLVLLLLLLHSPGRTMNDQRRNASVFQNASGLEDFMCYFLRNQQNVGNATLNERLFSLIDKHEENRNQREVNDCTTRNTTKMFIKTQLKQLAAKRIQSRALLSARRLAVAADCLRPAVVCIASEMTCLLWGDSGMDFQDFNRMLLSRGNSSWVPFLDALANIKGALLLVAKNRNILTGINWFPNAISPRRSMEDSDCIFLVTDTKEDALFVLSESSWSPAARYVVVIMQALSSGAYSDGLYEEGTEEGEDVDDVVLPEFDLHHYRESQERTMEARKDLWRRRRRRHISKINSTRTYSGTEKCSVSAHNMLRLLWYNRRLLHTAVIRTRCNISSTVGFIQGNVSTGAIYLLTHSGNLVTLPGDAIAAALDRLRAPLKNLGGRVLRISLFERKPTVVLIPAEDGGPPKLAGQDAWLLRLTARNLNFRVAVEEPQDKLGFGSFFQNGTASGTLSHLLYGKADISFNGFLVMDYGTRAVEFSAPFSFDELCVVVPRTAALPRWAAFLTTLPPAIIAVTPPTILCLTLILTAIRRLLHFRGSAVSDMLSVVSVCLSVSTRMPNSCSQRLPLIGATVAVLVVTGAFQGLIVRSIALPRYPTQIDTLEALDESGLYVTTGSETLKKTFDVPGGSILMEHLLRKTVVLTTRDELENHSNRMATLVRRLGVECDLTPEDHLVKECPRQYPVAFLTQRGSPIELPLNQLLLRFAAAGITKMLDQWTHGHHADQHQENDPRKVFSLEDLEFPFMVLGCGLGLSVVIFSLEIRIIRCRSNKIQGANSKRLIKRRVTL